MRTRFTQADISRALKAAKAAGFEVGAIEILADGGIRLVRADASKPEPTNPFDEWKAKRISQPGR